MPHDARLRPELAKARERGFFNIGEAAQASGISAKMIRHYELIGLIPPASRTFTNYRIYSEEGVRTLQFIKRARLLGFPMKQIAVLLSLWQDKNRSSSEAKRLVLEHVAELEVKIQDMQAMSNALMSLAKHCHGNDHPSCPILEDLAQGNESR